MHEGRLACRAIRPEQRVFELEADRAGRCAVDFGEVELAARSLRRQCAPASSSPSSHITTPSASTHAAASRIIWSTTAASPRAPVGSRPAPMTDYGTTLRGSADEVRHNRRRNAAHMATGLTFVSYSRTDSDFAVKLASDLRAKGADVWLDQLDIEAGARWDTRWKTPCDARRGCWCCSPRSRSPRRTSSTRCRSRSTRARRCVPVLVEPCTIPMRMRRLQYVDFTRGYEAGLARLLATLGVAQPSTRTAAPPTPPSSAAQTSPATTRPKQPPRPCRAVGNGAHRAAVTADARGSNCASGARGRARAPRGDGYRLVDPALRRGSLRRSTVDDARTRPSRRSRPCRRDTGRGALGRTRRPKAPPIQQRRAPEKASPDSDAQPGRAPESTSVGRQLGQPVGTGMLPRGDASAAPDCRRFWR